ncbi:hypothetical protein [Paenibacillus sp. PL91]|uniref:ATP-dependent DNA ligase n=1 Tax=Paenibacillus sp. PL91 TaxID=2729538 RepID=UPI00145EB841|nr:hypothetical protein [Paenibacillus sp. PL91]MBC9203728.1 hypothetical protein [Paenibacillus sp. PL91]
MIRFNTKKESAVKQIATTLKAHFPLWDILYLNGDSMLNKGFMERREALSAIIQSSETLSVTPIYEDGQALFLKAKELGLEGICQYNPEAPMLLDTRSKDVVKVKAYQYINCQIASVRLKGGFGWGLSVNNNYVGVMEFPPHSDVIRAFSQISKQLVRGENKDWRFLEPVITCKIKF